MIDLKNVTFSYEEGKALDDISYTFEDGKCYVIEGPNGCGKSTLFRILNGLSFATEGTYFFNGEEITEKKMKNASFAKNFHRQVGYLFQNSETQLFTRSVEDEVAFGLYQLGYEESEVKRRTDAWLEKLHLEHLRKRTPFTLSGGEKKRCALAAVLAMEPQTLIMDEPIAGLDEDGQNWIMKFISSLKDENRLMIIATHDRLLTEKTADIRVVMDKNHHIVQSDPKR